MRESGEIAKWKEGESSDGLMVNFIMAHSSTTTGMDMEGLNGLTAATTKASGYRADSMETAYRRWLLRGRHKGKDGRVGVE